MKSRWKMRSPARTTVCNLSRSLQYAAVEETSPHTRLGIAANDQR